ncbi:hypothetical protein [Polaribacter sp. Hel_I_88]|uniref:hypothetical protein n=1 Tax=Polaribacter sp. Hel_I_88 TaxID=1250006 RepID=UPI00047CF810|nr:hypothetical protein [Polaribacter sp. Hel_I_88]
MKSLKLEVSKRTTKNEFPYYVYLNRNKTLNFISKRKASDFIRLFQSNTNDCLRALNKIMSDIYSKYLDFYFYLDSITCIRIKNLIENYNDRISYFFKEYEIGNQSFKLTAFYKLFDVVEDLIFLINSFAKKSKNYQLVNSLNSHLKTSSLLLNHFDNTLYQKDLSKDYKQKTFTIVHKSFSMA